MKQLNKEKHNMGSIIRLTIITMVFIFNPGRNIHADPASQHVGVSLHENMLNSFFDAMGKISGKGSKKVLGQKIKYTWMVKEPKVDIEPGSATFKAKVKIKAGKIKTTKNAKGEMDITYLKETNRIKIRELKIKLSFEFLGQKVSIGTIDLAHYYKPSFEFAGPKPIQNQVEIEQPDKTKKIIYIVSANENLILEKDKVTVYSDLEFTTA